jgi:hypothetical protein
MIKTFDHHEKIVPQKRSNACQIKTSSQNVPTFIRKGHFETSGYQKLSPTMIENGQHEKVVTKNFAIL